MPKTMAIILRSDGQEPVKVRGELEDAEHARLVLYLEQWQELASCKPLKNGVPCNLNMKAEKGESVSVHAELPSTDDLCILLHRVRPFILEKEPASFKQIHSLIGKKIAHPEFREFLKGFRDLYDGRVFRDTVTISSDSDIVNRESVLLDWLNGFEYHRDPAKRAAITNLINKTPTGLTRWVIVSLLFDKIQAIEQLAALLSVMLGVSKEVHFRP